MNPRAAVFHTATALPDIQQGGFLKASAVL